MNSSFEYNFLYCFDSNYNLQGFTSIYSLLENIKKKVKVHIVHEDKYLKEKLPNKIFFHKNLENLNIYHFKNTKIEFPNVKGTHVSDATYFRLFIQNYIDSHIESLIYIDADTIFLNDPSSSIENNFDKLLNEGNFIAANTEFYFDDQSQSEKVLRLKIKKSYFNAGVLLINYKSWIESDLTNKLVDHLNLIKNDIVEWDQDVLNSYFNGQYTELNKRLNFNSNHISNDLISNNEIDLIHFIGSKKPWTIDGIFKNSSKYYHDYYSELYESKYHLVHTWKKHSVLVYVKNIINLNIFRFVKPKPFTIEFFKSLFKS